MRYGLELKIPRLSNKLMVMKNETNNVKAASIDASTNAVQMRRSMSRSNQRKRMKTNTRPVRVEARREALWRTKEARSPQPAKIVADSLSLDYFFPFSCATLFSNQTGASTCLTRPKWRGAEKQPAQTNIKC